jgi:hypothetical protein
VLKQIPVGDISASVQTAPAPDVPVGYGYASTPGSPPSNSSRHGGASMMQPYLSQSNISFTPFSFLTFPLHVQSQAVEANWLETAPEWDIADSNYGGAYNSANTSYNANYFTNGENTPEYYVSFNFIKHCPSALWQSASCPNENALSLGVAEHLDNYNWQFPQTGVSGSPTDSGGNPQASTGTFEELACHQREFATIAAFFASTGSADPFGYLQAKYNPYYYNYSANVTNFSNGRFFSQTADGTALTAQAQAANSAINVVYGWDVERQYGSNGLGTDPGDNPLFPYKGCS